MATSSITRNFLISDKEQVEMFANAIEESYQESLRPDPTPEINITYLNTADEILEFLAKRNKTNA